MSTGQALALTQRARLWVRFAGVGTNGYDETAGLCPIILGIHSSGRAAMTAVDHADRHRCRKEWQLSPGHYSCARHQPLDAMTYVGTRSAACQQRAVGMAGVWTRLGSVPSLLPNSTASADVHAGAGRTRRYCCRCSSTPPSKDPVRMLPKDTDALVKRTRDGRRRIVNLLKTVSAYTRPQRS